MQITTSTRAMNKVDYFDLGNGYADVFLRRNEVEEVDDEGNPKFVAEEVYFQIDGTVTKEEIVNNFDYFWNDAENADAKKENQEIADKLKKQLSDTDYKIIKCSEYQLAGLELPYNVAQLHAERQSLRDRINELE